MCGNKPENASFAPRLSEGLGSYIGMADLTPFFTIGDVAEWLRSGLQIRVRRFDSGRRLHRPSLKGFGG